ncbi:MAG: sigma-54-dependent Fis family transcriptional regulator [Deltaproteobacteria bacterium]|nr:sigma-54-dependent Fis family transcriptional regulator [Deltaproteobacteria bacterium]
MKVLVVDDDARFANAVCGLFEDVGHSAEGLTSSKEVLDVLSLTHFDVVLLDLHMPEVDGLSVLVAMREQRRNEPVIMISGQATIDAAVEAVRLGAADFIEKPFHPDHLMHRVELVWRYSRLARENAELKEDVRGNELLGESEVIRQLRRLIEKTAPTEGRVLITGENGTGKELVAEAIHTGSPRRDAPFVRVNCAALPVSLVESELFGHERGAFTGASARHEGRFERANRGTIFLDEIGDLPLAVQAKLLRVLQHGELERVGGKVPVRVNVRIIAATNRDLEAMVATREFREDLFYRLNVVRIRTPPLRERREDIPSLAQVFLERAIRLHGSAARRFGPGALEVLSRHSFPGNVRELQNLVERLVILSHTDEVSRERVCAELGLGHGTASAALGPKLYRTDASFKDLLQDAQRMIITEALSVHGSMNDTARALGLERSHLYKKCKLLGIDHVPLLRAKVSS